MYEVHYNGDGRHMSAISNVVFHRKDCYDAGRTCDNESCLYAEIKTRVFVQSLSKSIV